ncbi:MAG: DNA methyltransferase [Gammaproteobacteria bacterium]|nr:DNA methyltransferase [Gammaproteobacteria bacterium]
MDWPFGGLKAFSYDFIMADPPWPTKMRSPKGEAKSSVAKYGSMSFEEIAALPVGELAARDCVLFLWCVWPMVLYGGDPELRYADADASRSRVGEIIKAWGFRYVSGGAWHKRTTLGATAFGPGYRLRSSCEPFLLCTAGNPGTSRSARNLIEGLRREHSRKPDEAFAWCERYMPDARRVELFSRESRPGWDTWGFEAGKFDPVVTLQAEAA